MKAFLNRCGFRAASSGTGSFVVNSPLSGMQEPEDCAAPDVVDGATYNYFAESDDRSEWEYGFGVYDVATDTLTRAAVYNNDAGGTTAKNFAAAPRVVMGGLLAHDAVHVSAKYLILPDGAAITSGENLDASNDQFLELVQATASGFEAANFSGCSSLRKVYMGDNTDLASIDLTGCVSLTWLILSETGISTLDLSDCVDLVNCQVNSSGSAPLTSIDLSNCASLVVLAATTQSLTTIDVGDCVEMREIAMTNNALDEAAVDGVLVDLDSFGLNDGSADLSGGTNAPPSATGLTAKASLEGRGWTVMVN
jgi:hypothetical protein